MSSIDDYMGLLILGGVGTVLAAAWWSPLGRRARRADVKLRDARARLKVLCAAAAERDLSSDELVDTQQSIQVLIEARDAISTYQAGSYNLTLLWPQLLRGTLQQLEAALVAEAPQRAVLRERLATLPRCADPDYDRFLAEHFAAEDAMHAAVWSMSGVPQALLEHAGTAEEILASWLEETQATRELLRAPSGRYTVPRQPFFPRVGDPARLIAQLSARQRNDEGLDLVDALRDLSAIAASGATPAERRVLLGRVREKIRVAAETGVCPADDFAELARLVDAAQSDEPTAIDAAFDRLAELGGSGCEPCVEVDVAQRAALWAQRTPG